MYNKTQLQDFLSTVCGQYCCVYLLHKAKNATMRNFLTNNFERQQFRENDRRIVCQLKKNFNTRMTNGGFSFTTPTNKITYINNKRMTKLLPLETDKQTRFVKNLPSINKHKLTTITSQKGKGGRRRRDEERDCRSRKSQNLPIHVQTCRAFSKQCYKYQFRVRENVNYIRSFNCLVRSHIYTEK